MHQNQNTNQKYLTHADSNQDKYNANSKNNVNKNKIYHNQQVN